MGQLFNRIPISSNCGRIAPTNNGSGIVVGSYLHKGIKDDSGAVLEGFPVINSDRAVPDNSTGCLDYLGKRSSTLRANIEAHPAVRNASREADYLGLAALSKPVGRHKIFGENNPHALSAGLLHDLAGDRGTLLVEKAVSNLGILHDVDRCNAAALTLPERPGGF